MWLTASFGCNQYSFAGLDEKNEYKFNKEVVAPGNLSTWLTNMISPTESTTIWLDIVGYDASTFRDLSKVLEVDEDWLIKTLLFR
jgi:hypothetical protein